MKKLNVPFYEQTLDFTCGPACLMMAMRYFDKTIKMDLNLELDIWREANLVGIRGSSRYGLALAAHRRGFHTKIINNTRDMGYVEIVKDIRENVDIEMLNFFFKDIKKRSVKANIKETIKDIGVEDIRNTLDEGALPIVLVTAKYFSGEDLAHWILIKGYDTKHFYINNPLDEPEHRKEKFTINMIRKVLGYYGKKSLIAIYPKSNQP